MIIFKLPLDSDSYLELVSVKNGEDKKIIILKIFVLNSKGTMGLQFVHK